MRYRANSPLLIHPE